MFCQKIVLRDFVPSPSKTKADFQAAHVTRVLFNCR